MKKEKKTNNFKNKFIKNLEKQEKESKKPSTKQIIITFTVYSLACLLLGLGIGILIAALM